MSYSTILPRISLASEPELVNKILCGDLEPIQGWKALSDRCAMTARRIGIRYAGVLCCK